MTQNGGLDVLIACVAFGVLLALLCWVLVRHHVDPVKRATRADGPGPIDDESDDRSTDPAPGRHGSA